MGKAFPYPAEQGLALCPCVVTFCRRASSVALGPARQATASSCSVRDVCYPPAWVTAFRVLQGCLRRFSL